MLQHLDAADHRARRPASTGPADFIGLHFFSPVDKMPLVEIIRGERDLRRGAGQGATTSCQQIRKTPIVVNDSRGFYTSRVIGTMVNEGLAMLGRGRAPGVARAGRDPGRLPGRHAAALRRAQHGADGQDRARPPRDAAERDGHAVRRAPGDGGRRHDDRGSAGPRGSRARASTTTTRPARAQRLWPGPGRDVPGRRRAGPVRRTCKDRLLFVEALETAKCFEEGVIESAAAANIGSIMGIGFPPLTGGAAQFMNGYDGTHRPVGLAGFVARADELAETYGDRFRADGVPARAGREGRVLPRLTSPAACRPDYWPSFLPHSVVALLTFLTVVGRRGLRVAVDDRGLRAGRRRRSRPCHFT